MGAYGRSKAIQGKALHRLLFVLLPAALLLLGGCTLAAVTAAPATLPLTAAPPCDRAAPVRGCLYQPDNHYAVSPLVTATVAYTDIAGLLREAPIAIRLPISAPLPMPVVIWSHGGAEGHTNPARSMLEWSETTAAAGYLTISIAHSPRTDSLGGTRWALCQAIAAQVPGDQWDFNDPVTCQNFKYLNWDRPHDIRAVLDELERRNIQGALRGMIDLHHIALGGHSAGSSGALTVGGALRDLTGTPLDLSDPAARPVAFLAFSPQQPGSEGFFDTGHLEPIHSWQPITRPVLFGTGDGDSTCQPGREPGSCSGETPYGRRLPFERLPPGDKYRIYFHDADTFHTLFALDTRNPKCRTSAAQRQKCEAVAGALRSVALAFLDGYLRDDAFARQWLARNDVELATGGVAEWSRK